MFWRLNRRFFLLIYNYIAVIPNAVRNRARLSASSPKVIPFSLQEIEKFTRCDERLASKRRGKLKSCISARYDIIYNYQIA
jgi:hypothetical protein